ncbi:MAG: hypothetical protein ACXAE3_08795 [Candidatus Kariarchaeaceae archaeon]|jgi:hypothetical protein
MGKKQKPIKCKKCSNTFEVGSDEDKKTRNKEWTMVAPMPDKDGNVTITLMATWSCSNCGKTIRGSAGKTKGDFGGKSRSEQIADLLNSGAEFKLSDFATTLKVNEENLEKILSVMIKKGQADGKIAKGKYIPN